MNSIINFSFLSVGQDLALSESNQVNIYPNPVSGSTTIEYFLEKIQQVSVKVFNQKGQVVYKVLEGTKGAGRHKLKLEMAAIPSGIYLCKMQAGDQSEIKKIIKY